MDEAAAAGGPGRGRHVPIGPFAVFDGGLDEAADLCLEALARGQGMRVATANLDFVARARKDAQLRADLEASTLVVADGAPVVWLARFAGAKHVRRATGVDLVAELCQRGAERGGLRVAMYGSERAIATRAAAAFERMWPGVEVVLQLSPPFRPQSAEEVAADVAAIRASRPELVLVALGCPRQERFIAAHFDAAPGATWIGVGGTFDFYAGVKKRAPRALQRIGGEWLARLAQDPRRLWRRYLVDDLPALAATAAALAGSRLRNAGRARHEGVARPRRTRIPTKR